MSTPVIVLAKQRSGTNLLRKAIASSSSYFKDLDEVFHENGPGYFWKFYLNLITQDPQLCYPSKENKLKIFDAFLNQIGEFPEKFSLVDVKYNSTHHFNLFWHSPLEIPFLFRILAQKNIPVIHLIRANILETYISELLANKTEVYVINNENPMIQQNLSIKVDVKHMLSSLKHRNEEITIFKNWLKRTKSIQVLELNYESLLGHQNQISERVTAEIKKILGISDCIEIKVKTQKVSKPIKKIVANYDEVVNTLHQEGFSYLVPK